MTLDWPAFSTRGVRNITRRRYCDRIPVQRQPSTMPSIRRSPAGGTERQSCCGEAPNTDRRSTCGPWAACSPRCYAEFLCSMCESGLPGSNPVNDNPLTVRFRFQREQGNTDIEQLALVIKILGSPQTKDWPEVELLPDFNKIQLAYSNPSRYQRLNVYPLCHYSFSQSFGDSWTDVFPACTTHGELSLVDGLVRYNPRTRFTASEVNFLTERFRLAECFETFQALCSSYFASG